MRAFIQLYFALLATMTATVKALDGIVAPSQVKAGEEFEVTFQQANDDQYRVYLAASLAGSNGPTCYLINSTTLSDSVNVSIPAGVGPSADYYSVAIADLTTGQASTFSNRFNLSGATGNYSEYENHLGGSPFWSADDLPCSAYSCARQCAQASYPEDLTNQTAYNTMKQCILDCQGVTPAASQTAPAHMTATGAFTLTGEMAIITLGPDQTVTAIETTITSNGKTITAAVVGDMTITLGGAAKTISDDPLSLASNGVVVDGSTTVAFSSATITVAATGTEAATAAATTNGAVSDSKAYFAGAAAAGFAGLAFLV